jgi:hypothetical protein
MAAHKFDLKKKPTNVKHFDFWRFALARPVLTLGGLVLTPILVLVDWGYLKNYKSRYPNLYPKLGVDSIVRPRTKMDNLH